jgi:hypothetical protein
VSPWTQGRVWVGMYRMDRWLNREHLVRCIVMCGLYFVIRTLLELAMLVVVCVSTLWRCMAWLAWMGWCRIMQAVCTSLSPGLQPPFLPDFIVDTEVAAKSHVSTLVTLQSRDCFLAPELSSIIPFNALYLDSFFSFPILLYIHFLLYTQLSIECAQESSQSILVSSFVVIYSSNQSSPSSFELHLKQVHAL